MSLAALPCMFRNLVLLQWNPSYLVISWFHPTYCHSYRLTVWCYSQAYLSFDHAAELLARCLDWSALQCSGNVNDCWRPWHSAFLHIMEECIPRKQIPAKRNRPWFNLIYKEFLGNATTSTNLPPDLIQIPIGRTIGSGETG